MKQDGIVSVEGLESRALLAAPPAPLTTAPGLSSSPGPELVALTPTFTWQPSAGAARYGLYVRDPANGTVLYSKTDISGSATSFRIPSGPLKNFTSYSWNMRAWNSSNQQSGLSSLKYFQTDAPRVEGIDVSKWQLTINWTSVRNAGKQFAFIKATEASSIVDPNWATNRTNATNVGVINGFYHRARPLTSTAIAEADHFSNTILPYLKPGRMRPVLDLEEGHENGKTWLSAWAVDFLNRVEQQTGIRPLIYANTWYASTYFTTALNQWDIWIANWLRDPTDNPTTGIYPDWSFWQYTDSGTVSGISTAVDLDVFNGTREQLLRQFVIQPRKGDLNGDGSVNNQDIAGFVKLLTDPAGYQQQYPLVVPDMVADFNDDGIVNNQDIGGFVASLTGPRPTLGIQSRRLDLLPEKPVAPRLAGQVFSDIALSGRDVAS